jgi:hypothetical protein
MTLALLTVLDNEMLSVLTFMRLLNRLAARDFFLGIGTCVPAAPALEGAGEMELEAASAEADGESALADGAGCLRVALAMSAGVLALEAAFLGLTTLALMEASLSLSPPSSPSAPSPSSVSSAPPTSSLSATDALKDRARRRRPLSPLPLTGASLAWEDELEDAAAASARVARRERDESARDESSRLIRRSARVALVAEDESGERVGGREVPWLSGLGRASFAALEDAEEPEDGDIGVGDVAECALCVEEEDAAR